MNIADSGNRREFGTGAVRDIAEGKGRCDLLPLDIIGNLTSDDILLGIGIFIRSGDKSELENAMIMFLTMYFKSVSNAWLEVAIHYEDGCQKYGERNWEKGIPLHCFIDSGVRHYLKFKRGDTDERHDRAFLWNMLGALWTLKHKPELCDLPFNDWVECVECEINYEKS